MRGFLRELINAAMKVKTGGNAENNKALGCVFIITAVIMFSCTIIQTFNTKSMITEIKIINGKMGHFWITVGVQNDEGAFVKRVDAQSGEERLVQFSYRNDSGRNLSSLAGRVVLPEALEYVTDSTVLYNRTNPKGISIADGIAVEWIGLGAYNIYDGEGRGEGSVSFRVKVSNNMNLFVPGVNTFNVACQIAGNEDELLVEDAVIAYAAIDVVKE